MYGKSKAKSHAQYIAEADETRQADLARLDELIREVAPELEPTMEFGMMGYGKFHYKYATGREGDWMKLGVANNKRYISLYCCSADERGYVAERYKDRLPKADIGKSCVRFKRLSDLDEGVLRDLLRESAEGEFGV